MRLSYFIAAWFLIVGVSSGAEAQGGAAAPCNLPHAPGVLMQQRLISSERDRSYRLFVPQGYDGRTALPLVLEMHGSGGTSAGQARTSGFEELAARESLAVASLQADGGRWNVPVDEMRASDVTYVGDVIDDIARRLCIDRTRVYATGFSGGGRMSSLLGCMLNTRVAAIAPVSGLRWPEPCTGSPIPVLTFHGLADTQNPYSGNVAGRNGEWVESVPEALAGWAGHNGCDPDAIVEDLPGRLSTLSYANCKQGTEVRIILIDGLGHTWTRQEIDTTAAIWQFFKTHRRPQ